MSRSNNARDLLLNPVFKDMENILKRSLYDQWITCESIEDREILHNKVSLIDDLIGEITTLALETRNGR